MVGFVARLLCILAAFEGVEAVDFATEVSGERLSLVRTFVCVLGF